MGLQRVSNLHSRHATLLLSQCLLLLLCIGMAEGSLLQRLLHPGNQTTTPSRHLRTRNHHDQATITLGTSSTTNGSSRDLESRIVGGTPAMAADHPYFAYWSTGCGGSLIHPDIVLTAAHCYWGTAGRVWINSIDRREGYEVAVQDVRSHYLYNNDRNDPDWDYLVLKLATPVPASIATPVRLNADMDLPLERAGSTMLQVVGFGRMEEGGKSDSEVLRYADIPYIPTDTCNQAYDGKVNEAMMCAGDPPKDACQGDSGGPLLQYVQQTNPATGTTTTVPTLVGIVSWGLGCGREGYPGVYSRVSTAMPWIRQQVCLLSELPPSDLCETTMIPLPMRLRIEIQLAQGDNLQDYSYGLYHIDTATTIYEVEDPEDQPPMDTPNLNPNLEQEAGIPIISKNLARKKEEEEEEEKETEFQSDSDGTNPAAQQGLATNSYFEKSFDNLQPGTYYFQFKDRNADGFGAANAYARVVQGNRRVMVQTKDSFTGFFDGYFTLRSEIEATELDNGLVAANKADIGDFVDAAMQAPAVAYDTVNLTVDIMYDNDPWQTNWELRDLNTGSLIKQQPFNTLGDEFKSRLVSNRFDVPQGHTYQLIVRDLSGNGMCCSNGAGRILVYTGWKQLWDFNGQFTSEINRVFEL